MRSFSRSAALTAAHRSPDPTENPLTIPIPTVLVVNDDEALREMLSDALQSEGYAVLTAANGAEALAILEATRPALILADVLMPVMDGPTFLRAYRAATGPHAPTVCLSAGAFPPHAEMVALADAVPGLPLDLDEFFAVVKRFARATHN